MPSSLTVYKASAGSGKTFTIAAEYIALLLGSTPNMYRHILAVTFTNKATGEMKERILHSLHQIAYPGKSGSDPAFLQAVRQRISGPVDDKELRRRATVALGCLLHDYDNFHVKTIDAFFQWLLASLAHELGLSATYKIDLNERLVVEKAVDELIAKVDEEPHLRGWILNYIEQRISEDKSWDIRGELRSMAGQLRVEQYQLSEKRINQFMQSIDSNGKTSIHHLKTTLNNTCRKVKEELEMSTRNFVDIIEQNGGYKSFNRLSTTLGAYVRKMQNGTYDPPSPTVLTLMATSPFEDNERSSKLVWLKKADQKRWDELRPLAENIHQGLIAIEQLRSTSMSLYNTCQLILDRLDPLYLLSDISRKIDEINQADGHFLLSRTPRLFYEMVHASDAPFVFEKAGTHFHHIMIDEFQDTSPLQWANFKSLLLNDLASGDHCMLVGDVKQSIYRFRGGDYKILHNIEKEMQDVHPEIRPLNTNFRSAREIIHFVGKFFPAASQYLASRLPPDDSSASADEILTSIYADAEVQQLPTDKAGGYVWIEAVQASDNNADTDSQPTDADQPTYQVTEMTVEERLYDTICQLRKQGLQWNDMAILVRKRRSARELLSYFVNHHRDIPLISDEAFCLSSSTAVICVIYALRHIACPEDEVAAAYLGERLSYLSKRERPSQEASIERRLGLLVAEWTALPLYECCSRIIHDFHLDEYPEESPYLMHFLDEVLDYVTDSLSDIPSFLQYWEDTLSSASVPGGNGEGICIQTIHKSKGLAYHTVLMPYCDWMTDEDLNDDIIWTKPQLDCTNDLPLVPISTRKKAIRNSYFSDAYNEEHREQRIENMNLLYVAFTRARWSLYVWYPLPKSDRSSIANIIHNVVTADTTNSLGLSDSLVKPLPPSKPDSSTETQYVQFEAKKSHAMFVQSQASVDFIHQADDENDAETVRQYIDRGRTLHAILASCRRIDDLSITVRDFQRRGILPAECEPAELTATLRLCIAEIRHRGWFPEDDSRVLCEAELLIPNNDGRSFRTIRPDRVILPPEDAAADRPIIVVDYKFGQFHAPDTRVGHTYIEQVSGYIQAIHSIYHRPVRGYLWFVDAHRVVDVAADSEQVQKTGLG